MVATAVRPRQLAYALTLLAACSGGPHVEGQPNPAPHAELRVDLFPTQLSFGQCPTDTSCQQVLQIVNVGEDEVVVMDLLPPEGSQLTVQAPAIPFISPGSAQEVVATWHPLDPVALTGSLTVILRGSEDQVEEIEVPLDGWGQGSKLVISGAGYDYGELPVGCAANASLTVTNTGNQPADVERILVTGVGYKLRYTNANPPQELGPFQSIDLDVVFEPQSTDATTGLVQIMAGDASVETNLTGVGTIDGERWLTFTPGSARRTTMIFHVNSAAIPGSSWSPYGAIFEAALPTFFEAMQESSISYRVLFVEPTTGVSHSSTDYIDQTYSPEDATEEALDMLGAYGSGGWSDNDSSYATLLNAIRANDDWLFEDASWEAATLNLVGINRDTEQSGGHWATYVSQAQAYKDDPDDVTFHAIGGKRTSTCPSIEYFTPFDLGVADTDGLFLDACEPDWSDHMRSLAAEASGGSPFFRLEGNPLESSIEVSADGVLIGHWSYDDGLNAIVFDTDHYPDWAIQLEVHYLMSDGCD